VLIKVKEAKILFSKSQRLDLNRIREFKLQNISEIVVKSMFFVYCEQVNFIVIIEILF